MYSYMILLVTLTRVGGQECYDDGAEFCIDENDILSADLLPGSILFMDQLYRENHGSGSNLSRTVEADEVDGTRDKALEEMDYHRKRMNEYLYHGYYAEEIIKEVGLVRVKRKNDSPSEDAIPDFLEDQNATIRDKLLADEGSVNYKKWMLRKDTLDDIRRHHVPGKSIQKKHEVYEEPELAEGDVAAEFEGEIVAMQPQHAIGKMGKPSGMPYPPDVQPAQTGYNYPTYGAPPMHYPPIHLPPEHVYEEYEEDDHEVYHSSGKGHDLSIKDFFEIALTALAFLAFGLFVIQLLMNIANPMTTTTTTTAATVITEIDQRFKRHILDTRPLGYEAGNQELDELSHRVLRSIEASLVAQSDRGNCTRRLLCEDNRYSRDTQGGRRIWIPVWSLGMSWLSGRMLNQRAPWPAMMDSLKAAILGLGRADCETLYPDCQLGRERIKRRRRRRK